MKSPFWTSLFALQGLLLLSDCCGPNPPAYFRRTGLEVLNVVLSDPSQYTSSRDWTGDTAAWPTQSYGLGLNFAVRYVAQATPSVGNRAYADTFFSCSQEEPGRYGSHEQITALSVTSTSAFDSAHAAGTSLNDLFYLIDYGYGQEVPLDSAFITPSQPKGITSWTEDLVLHLRQRPAPDSTFVFRVRVELSDGSRFEAVSPRVVFRK